jgi:hypothetical protein
VNGDTAPLVLVIDATGKPMLIEWMPHALPGSRWRFERPRSLALSGQRGNRSDS